MRSGFSRFSCLILTLFLVSQAVPEFVAEDLEIPGIRVLESTQADVERAIEKGKDGRFTWKGKRVFVDYAEDRCGDHGWDVPEGTVLSYSISFPFETLLSSFRRWDLKDSTGYHDGIYIIDEKMGVKVSITPVAGRYFEGGKDNAFVHYLSFNPKASDAYRRCFGYPEYRLGNELHYTDIVHGPIPIEDMMARCDITLSQVKNSPLISVVFITYLSEGTSPDELKRYEPLRDYVRQQATESGIEQGRIKFVFGGYERSEKTYQYLYFTADEPPLPTPTAPCLDSRCYKEIGK